MNISAVILAAGKGTRMYSEAPKVVHRLAGKPLVKHVADIVKRAGINRIILVLGHKRQMVAEVFSGEQIEFAIQEEQLGTGHALLQTQDCFDNDEEVLVLAGDTPLLTADTIKRFLSFHREKKAKATVMSALLPNPTGYGRIIRDNDNNFLCIVEEKDALPEQKKIQEINSGIYCLNAGAAFAALKGIKNNNAQGEYYLTDVLAALKHTGYPVVVYCNPDSEEIQGINDRVQLAAAEKILRQRKNLALMQSGVTIMDPASTFIDEEVQIGKDTIIYPWTVIEGTSKIGESCLIGPSAHLSQAVIGNRVKIENSRVDDAVIDDDCLIGPYTYIRPGTELGKNVKIGDFVEIKKSTIGEHSKVPHLSYIGDATLGKKVNIGAGTITCNYDGIHKYSTIIDDGAFIGSNSNLVAPLKIGANAFTGAGSTITHDIPECCLGVERSAQKIIRNFKIRNKQD